MFAASTRRSAFVAVRRTSQLNRHISTTISRNSIGIGRTMSSSSLTKWDRLVRYVSAKDGKTKYGEPIVDDGKADIDDLAQKGELKVKVLEGSTPFDAAPTGEQDEVKTLLGPLTPKDVPVVRCTGLNYKTHSEWNADHVPQSCV
jgi:hypothetical protein